MDPSFGARLRARREQQQVSLSAIADASKIKLSILEGLERDDVSQWPDGIYRRAYVRAYARAVGLDPDALVREFLEAHPDPVVTGPGTDAELEDPPWPAGIRRLVTSAMAAIPSRRARDARDRPESAHADATLRPAARVPEPQGPDASVREPVQPVAPESGGSPTRPDHRTPRPEPSLQDAADLSTRLARVRDPGELASALEDAARACDAVGLIVWSWDARTEALRPVLAHGYTDTMLARLPGVQADADNAIASAFRSDRLCIVDGGDDVTGAVVVPLASHHGCVGVLAIELRHGGEQRAAVRAFASILAAQLVILMRAEPLSTAITA